MKHLRRHLRIPRGVEEVWIWWDYISVPQKNRELQAKAISSVVAYAQLASRFLPLVRDADAWEELYDEDLGVLPAGALGTYAVRGWCRLEVVAGLAPTTAVAVRSARLRLMDVQIYRTAPWRATAVFAGAERDDDDDDDGLAWGEVISYEPSPDLGDVPVAVPIPSAPPAEAIRA